SGKWPPILTVSSVTPTSEAPPPSPSPSPSSRPPAPHALRTSAETRIPVRPTRPEDLLRRFIVVLPLWWWWWLLGGSRWVCSPRGTRRLGPRSAADGGV